MANIFTYTQNIQYDSFYDVEPTILDMLALTEMTYLPFDGMRAKAPLPDQSHTLARLSQEFHVFFQGDYPPLSMVTPERLKLLEQLSQFKRFKHIKAFSYVNDYNLEAQKQFAAMTYQIRPEEYVVVFRGTDDTLIGWKEDFHMTYMEEIPAQQAAREYLTQQMQQLDGLFYIAGHSKGGNLATFAAATIQPEAQAKIKQIYSFDAPGLHPSVLESEGFHAIEDRIQAIVPEQSIIGLLLEPPTDSLIVKSAGSGLLQHISFNWQIDGLSFQTVQNLDKDSLQVDKTLKTWTASLSPQELKEFFDLFFGIFLQAGILRFSDLTVDTSTKLRQLIQQRKELTPEQDEMMDRLTKLLIDTRIQVWKDNLPKMQGVQAFFPESLDLKKLRIQRQPKKNGKTLPNSFLGKYFQAQKPKKES